LQDLRLLRDIRQWENRLS